MWVCSILGGESGIPLRLQLDVFYAKSQCDESPLASAGCQVKVFKVCH